MAYTWGEQLELLEVLGEPKTVTADPIDLMWLSEEELIRRGSDSDNPLAQELARRLQGED